MQSFTEVEDIYCILKNVFDYHRVGKHEVVKKKGGFITWEKKIVGLLVCLCEGVFVCRCSSV